MARVSASNGRSGRGRSTKRRVPGGTRDSRLTNLPIELTSFLGREADLASLKAVIGRSRLVTISGTGGLGKTRISLHLAAELTGEYPDGVWLIELAPPAIGRWWSRRSRPASESARCRARPCSRR